MTFASLGLPASIVQGVRAAGLNEPTPIQSKAIPVILQGNDLIGNAASGSGKTAAFLLPTLARLLDGPSKLRALVLTPTREHAAQVEGHAREFARYTELRVGAAHDAAPLAAQERVLRDPGVDLLVATPQRLLELHQRQILSFEDVEILVLDEADRLVDLGLATDLRRLLKLLPETRQTLLFSATMPAELNRLSKEALIEPVRVDLAAGAAGQAGITHAIYPVPRHLKTELLDYILSRSGDVRSTIVFTRQREGADRLCRQLEKRGYAAVSLHDHKSQTERERAMEDLKRGRVGILVATDLAARGIDLGGVAHIVNFDVPPTPEDYVHRIGRAGRPDAQGDAFTLMGTEEQRHLAAIERFVGRAIPRVLLPDFDYGVKPSQVQQAAIYDDDRARLRRAATKMPFAAARVAPPAPVPAAKLKPPIPSAAPMTKPKTAQQPVRPKSSALKPAALQKARPVPVAASRRPIPVAARKSVPVATARKAAPVATARKPVPKRAADARPKAKRSSALKEASASPHRSKSAARARSTRATVPHAKPRRGATPSRHK